MCDDCNNGKFTCLPCGGAGCDECGNRGELVCDCAIVTVQGEPRNWRVYVGGGNDCQRFTALASAKAYAKAQCLPGDRPILLGRAGWATPSGQQPTYG